MRTGGGLHRALIVLDGLGDGPDARDPRTAPVGSARTPFLDRILGRGTSGLLTVVGPGIAPESDAGVLALLGYDPVKESPGRGVLEALGIGLDLLPGDVALRLNFATQDSSGRIVDSRVGRSLSTTEAADLAKGLTQRNLLGSYDISAEVCATVGHRGVLRLHPIAGGPLSPAVSNADPFYERSGGLGKAVRPATTTRPTVLALEDSDAARRTAAAINEFLRGASELLETDPLNAARARDGKLRANALLLRNAGSIPDPPPVSFAEKHGLEGVAITEMPVERGIARLLGFKDRFVGPMGADREASLEERAAITQEELESSPFVYVHLKGPDEPGHDGNPTGKKEVVEALDRSFFGPFLRDLDWADIRLAVTADHATPCSLHGHSDDPVPLVIAGSGVTADSGPRKFGELSAEAGRLGQRRGAEVIALLKSPSLPAP